MANYEIRISVQRRYRARSVGGAFGIKNAPAFTEAFVRQLTERIGVDALRFFMLL